MDLRFAVNYEIKLFESKKNVTDNYLVKFKTEAVDFLAEICTHWIEKNVHYHLILPDFSHAYHQYLIQSVQMFLKLLSNKFYLNWSILKPLKPLLILLLARQDQSITNLKLG